MSKFGTSRKGRIIKKKPMAKKFRLKLKRTSTRRQRMKKWRRKLRGHLRGSKQKRDAKPP